MQTTPLQEEGREEKKVNASPFPHFLLKGKWKFSERIGYLNYLFSGGLFQEGEMGVEEKIMGEKNELVLGVGNTNAPLFSPRYVPLTRAVQDAGNEERTHPHLTITELESASFSASPVEDKTRRNRSVEAREISDPAIAFPLALIGKSGG